MQFLERLVFYLDDVFEIPIIKKRIGFDPIVGLIPVFGDILGYVFSIVPIFYAIKEGVSSRVLLRMLLNSFVDTTLGGIPILGDVFDFLFQSNRRNFNLLKAYRESPEKIKKRTTVHFILIAILFLIVLISICVGIWLLLHSLVDYISSYFAS